MKPKIITDKGLIHPSDKRETKIPARLQGSIKSVLISSTAIKEQTRQMARAVTRDSRQAGISELELIIALKGAAVFGCMLAREIFICGGPEIRLNFIRAASYGHGTTSSGDVKIEGHLPKIKNRHVLIVEDIVDTGLTLSRLKAFLQHERGAASVRFCALLNKPERRLPELRKSLKIDYIGFCIPNLFVVGMGLDCAERFRELPFVAVVNH